MVNANGTEPQDGFAKPRHIRILTDLYVRQIPWWSERLSVLPRPRWNGWFGSAIAAWHTVSQSRSFDAVIASSLRNALALGLYKRLCRRRSPALVLVEVRLDDPRSDVWWRLKIQLQRFGFAAVDVFCVSARQEATSYATRLGLSPERFQFVPWHTNVLDPRWHPASGGYLLAAGRTGRDWPTLAAAVRGLDVPITVICPQGDADGAAFPPNVTVLTDLPYADYRTLLEGATAVIVPLEPHVYSSGQVVILEAMALGKAVIATRVLGSEDYIDHDVDGFLVAPGDVAAMRSAIQRLVQTSGLAERVGRSAVDKVARRHTLEQYVRRIIEIAETVAPETVVPSHDERRAPR